MPIPDNWTSTTTTIIIALPMPTITVPLTTTTTTISTTTTVPVVTPPPITIQPPTIIAPQIMQHPGNITLRSQRYSANIQSVSVPQPLIISINRTFPTELYLNVSVPINLSRPNLTPPTLYRKVLEEDGTVVYVAIKINETHKELAIKKLENRLILESEGIVATTESTLEINESGVYVGKTELKVLPSEASEIAEDIGMSAIENIELKEVGQKPVYELKGSKKGKLLGVIPVDMKVELHVNANTAEVIKKKEPWWSFLVRGEEK